MAPAATVVLAGVVGGVGGLLASRIVARRRQEAWLAQPVLMAAVGAAIGVALALGLGRPGARAHELPALRTAGEFTAAVGSPRPVVVDYYASWCGPCRTLAPLLEEVAQDYAGRVDFYRIDADAHRALRDAAGVEAYPTVVFYRGGVEVGRLVGLPRDARGALRRRIDALLAAPPPAPPPMPAMPARSLAGGN